MSKTKRNPNENIQDNQLANILNRISDGFVALDKNWCYTYMNKNAGEIFNRDPAKMIGKHIWTEFPEGVGQPFYHAYEKAMAEQKYIYLEEYYPPYDKWFENHIYPSPDGVSIYFRDITKRKKIVEDQTKEHRFIESIINASSDIIYIYDIEERNNVYVNEGIQKNLGYTDEEIKQMGSQVLPILMHPEDFEYYLHNTYPRYATAKNKEIITHEFRLKDKSGTWHWFYCKESVFLRKSDGTPKQIFGITNDITERKKAEAERKKSIERFETIALATNDGLWEWNFETGELWANKIHQHLYELAQTDPVPGFEQWEEKIHPDDRERIIADQHEALASDKKVWISEYRFNTKVKGFIDIYDRTYIVRNEAGKAIRIIGSMMDITERKKAEKELVESENHLRTILQSEPECVKLLNQKGEIMDMNPAGLAMIEAESLDMIKGSSVLGIINDSYKKAFSDLTNEIFKGNSGILEFEITGLKGTSRWLETHAVPLKNTEGEIISLLGVTRDITEHKKAEQSIKESEERYALVVQAVNDGLWDWNIITHEAYLSPRCKEIVGYKDDELPNHESSLFKLIHSDDKAAVGEAVRANLEEEKPYSIEFRLRHKDNSFRWVLSRGMAVRDTSGQAIRMIGTIKDITERKKAEETIKESEEQYKDLVENITDLICMHDLDGKILSMNRAAEKITGHSFNQQGNLNIKDILTTGTTNKYESYIADIIKNGHAQGLMKVRTSRGEIRNWEFNNSLKIIKGMEPVVRGYARDVTERKKAEEELRLSENRTKKIFEAGMIGFIFWDANGEILDANDLFLEMTGYSKKDLMEKKINWNKMTPPEYAELDRRGLEQIALTGICQPFEKEYLRKDGSRLQVLLGATSFEGNSQEKGVAYVMDITERKKAEQAIKESEEKFRTLVQQAADAIFVVDQEGNYLDANDSASLITGYSIDELKKMNGRDIIEDEDLKTNPIKLEEIKKGDTVYVERLIKRKDNALINVDIKAKLMDNGKVIVILRDITERKKAEKAIYQLNESLEQRVKERTVELEKANAELKEINDLFIGREARIIELKEELEALKNKI